MKDIPIFKAEASVDGLADMIRANSSITYASQLKKWELTDEIREHVMAAVSKDKALADAHDTDLYYTQSILVSSNWNLNDDVFDRAETWAARHTPAHKPTNLEHDEKTLVGHITNSWGMTEDGVLIPDNTMVDDLPDMFHIVNGAVIYTRWADEQLMARTDKLIAEIESGEKFVSMECLFTNFDYAVISPDNSKFHVVARNEDTAYLTKYLRAYGGQGAYEDYQIGRLLRNITFCGKGYVDKPANPNSILLNDASKFHFTGASQENPFSEKNGVILSCSHNAAETNSSKEDSNMSEEMKATIAEQKAELKELKDALTEANKQLSEQGVKRLEAKIEKQQTAIDELTSEKEALAADKEKHTEAIETLTEQLSEANDEKAKLEEKIAVQAAEALMASRVSMLTEKGLDKETAATKAELFSDLNDEQFAAIAEALAVPKTEESAEASEEVNEDESNDDEENDEQAEANADEEVLDNAEPVEDVDLSTAGAEDNEDDSDTQLKDVVASWLQLGKSDTQNEENN